MSSEFWIVEGVMSTPTALPNALQGLNGIERMARDEEVTDILGEELVNEVQVIVIIWSLVYPSDFSLIACVAIQHGHSEVFQVCVDLRR
jgi:hypothetical protein